MKREKTLTALLCRITEKEGIFMRYSYECKERVLNRTGKERIGNALLLDGEVIGGGGYIGQTAKRKGIYRL